MTLPSYPPTVSFHQRPLTYCTPVVCRNPEDCFDKLVAGPGWTKIAAAAAIGGEVASGSDLGARLQPFAGNLAEGLEEVPPELLTGGCR